VHVTRHYRLDNLNVMIVDDDPNIAALMCDLLGALGIGKTLAAPNGEVARRILSERDHGQVDLVFTDYAMDPGNGADLLEWIRRGADSPNRFMPVVLMTGHTDVETMLRMRNLGITGVLAKPISLQSLCRLLTGLIEAAPRFVETGRYFGPDRRRREVPYRGGERRGLAEERT
jgi:CheY-like chemotaxis protein